MFLKVKDKETKRETGTNSFQTAVSLISTFFICKSYAHFHMYMCSKSFIYAFAFIHLFMLFVYDSFVCHFIPLCEVSKGILSLLLWRFFCPSVYLFFSLTVRHHWEIWLWHRIYFQKNLVLSVNSIITMLVKLLQMILGYVTSFVMTFSLSPRLYLLRFERYAFHIILVLCHLYLILVGPGVLVVRAS